MVQYGIKVVFGVPETMKTIIGLPDGDREDAFIDGQIAKIAIRASGALKIYALEECGDHWKAFETLPTNPHRPPMFAA